MKILYLSAEVAPFVSVGGLSQVTYFLPKALRELGHDVRIFTPRYGAMETTGRRKKGWKLSVEIEDLKIPVSDSKKNGYLQTRILSYRGRMKNPLVYFIDNGEYFTLRANVFSYKDDHIRFMLLSKGCLEWLLIQHKKRQRSDKVWFPDIVHVNDWHTGYFVDLARRNDRYSQILSGLPILLTVHNFLFQGNYDFRFRPLKGNDTGKEPLEPILSPRLIKQNALKRGMLFADAVNTVSMTHAREVLTTEYGHGLDDVLHLIRGKLNGIINGLDTKEFNPETDPLISVNFSANSFQKQRRENKSILQEEFSLKKDDSLPLIVISGRLSQQKGWDLILETLPHLLSVKKNLQVIILGNGDDRFRDSLLQMQKQFSSQIGLHLRPDFRLPRKLFAGADIILIPSIFEPGGIVALEALRYGAVPVVRRTGGLNDVIEDFDAYSGKGNGFSFISKDRWEFFASVIKALTIYENPKLWNTLVKNCLKCDFSWRHSAKEYEDLYLRLIEQRRRAISATPHPAYIQDKF